MSPWLVGRVRVEKLGDRKPARNDPQNLPRDSILHILDFSFSPTGDPPEAPGQVLVELSPRHLEAISAINKGHEARPFSSKMVVSVDRLAKQVRWANDPFYGGAFQPRYNSASASGEGALHEARRLIYESGLGMAIHRATLDYLRENTEGIGSFSVRHKGWFGSQPLEHLWKQLGVSIDTDYPFENYAGRVEAALKRKAAEPG